MGGVMRWAVAVIVLFGIGVLLLPRERVDTDISFDPASIGDDLDAHLAALDAPFDDITPGVEKRIIWADAPGVPTEDVVVYIHGFSATSEEIRPVPDLVAAELGANLLFWRLAGHGRTGDAMAEPSAGDWIEDTAHALSVATRLGDSVTVLSTSTGGTLAAVAAIHPDLFGKFDRVIFVSPNFEIANPDARYLTWPGARHWIPVVAGTEREFEPITPDHGKYWTTRYPSVAVIPLGALVKFANAQDYSATRLPALFLFSDDDRVVSAKAARALAARWGGPATVAPQVIGDTDDPFDHVIAGDILSPGMTDSIAAQILDWIEDN